MDNETDDGGGERELRPGASSAIDENLKRVYQDLQSQEVPDRFRALLDQLRSGGEPADEAGSGS